MICLKAVTDHQLNEHTTARDTDASVVMVGRLDRVYNDAVTVMNDGKSVFSESFQKDESSRRQMSVAYYWVREETDLFPDASTLDLMDYPKKKDIDAGIKRMVEEAIGYGIPKDNQHKLWDLVL